MPAPQQIGQSKRRFMMFRCVSALMLREMATRYGKSLGGYVWAILEPVGAILLLVAGFSLLVRSPALGSSFLLFFATGYMPFAAYQSISNYTARAITFSKPLLRYPAVTWVDAIAARFILNSLTEVLVMLIIFGGTLALMDTRTLLDFPSIVLSVGLALFFGLGVGVLNCALSGLIGAWTQVWSILTRPLFFASGVFFLFEDMTPILQKILWYNPLIHIIGLMRAGFYPNYHATYVSIPFCLAAAIVPLFLGIVLLGRYHREILQEQ